MTTPHLGDITSPPPVRYRSDAEIGELVHQELWRQGVPQARLAKALDIDAAAVSRRLRGQTLWRISELNVVADLLGLDMHVFQASVGAA